MTNPKMVKFIICYYITENTKYLWGGINIRKFKNIIKFSLILLLIIILSGSVTGFEHNNIILNQRITEEYGVFYGQVKEAVTCIPNPLKDAKVIAVGISPFSIFFKHYETISNENGEYELTVEPGTYRVFARKSGYFQVSPKLFKLETIEAGEYKNYTIIMSPIGWFNQIENTYLFNIQNYPTKVLRPTISL